MDERLLMAAPRLRRLVALGLRRPLGSALRRTLVTRILQVGIAANNRGDYEAMSSSFHPEVELHIPPGERTGPDMEPVYRGRDGYIRALRAWKESFGEDRWELREIFDSGRSRFGSRGEHVARGLGSGAEVRLQEFWVLELEDGLLRRQWLATDQDAMLRLLGQ